MVVHRKMDGCKIPPYIRKNRRHKYGQFVTEEHSEGVATLAASFAKKIGFEEYLKREILKLKKEIEQKQLQLAHLSKTIKELFNNEDKDKIISSLTVTVNDLPF